MKGEIPRAGPHFADDHPGFDPHQIHDLVGLVIAIAGVLRTYRRQGGKQQQR